MLGHCCITEIIIKGGDSFMYFCTTDNKERTLLSSYKTDYAVVACRLRL